MIARRTLAALCCAGLAACALRSGSTHRRTLVGVTAHQAHVAALRVLSDGDFEVEEGESGEGPILTAWRDRARKSTRYEISVEETGTEERPAASVAVRGEKRDRAVRGWSRGYPDPSASTRLLDDIEGHADRVPPLPTTAEAAPEPEAPAAEPERECSTSRECPPGQHCTGRGQCVWECATDSECEEPARCDQRGRCVSPPPPQPSAVPEPPEAE